MRLVTFLSSVRKVPSISDRTILKLMAITLLVISEGHTHEREEFASLFIRMGGGDDDDIHTADFINFIVLNFRENRKESTLS